MDDRRQQHRPSSIVHRRNQEAPSATPLDSLPPAPALAPPGRCGLGAPVVPRWTGPRRCAVRRIGGWALAEQPQPLLDLTFAQLHVSLFVAGGLRWRALAKQ